MSLGIREYRTNNYEAARQLWVELTEHHRRIYGDRSIGGDDPGAGFDDYLALSARTQSWVADWQGTVVGLTGLLDHGVSAEIEPVVVSEEFRQRGIGRALIDHVVRDAARRGYEYLSIRPVARNVAAIERFHQAGFRTLGGHVDLTMDLKERRHGWLEGVNLHGVDFRY